MPNNLLTGGIAATIGKAMSGIFRAATLTINQPGSGPAYNPGPSTPVSYPCKAIVDEWSAYDQRAGLVNTADRKILVLAASLAVEPVVNGRVAIDGKVFTIYSDGQGQPGVSTDPAKAVWVLRCRG